MILKYSVDRTWCDPLLRKALQREVLLEYTFLFGTALRPIWLCSSEAINLSPSCTTLGCKLAITQLNESHIPKFPTLSYPFEEKKSIQYSMHHMLIDISLLHKQLTHLEAFEQAGPQEVIHLYR